MRNKVYAGNGSGDFHQAAHLPRQRFDQNVATLGVYPSHPSNVSCVMTFVHEVRDDSLIGE